MSAEYKTKYEVIKILRDITMMGLGAFGETGWDCMEFGQATFQRADRIVTLQLLRTNEQGFSGSRSFLDENNNFITEWDKLEQQDWQFQIILRRGVAPVSGDTQTAEDIASKLILYLNGPAVEEFRKRGVSPLRIDSSNIFVYNDDSTVYQRRAVFTVKIFVPKAFRIGQDSLDAIKPDIKPV